MGEKLEISYHDTGFVSALANSFGRAATRLAESPLGDFVGTLQLHGLYAAMNLSVFTSEEEDVERARVAYEAKLDELSDRKSRRVRRREEKSSKGRIALSRLANSLEDVGILAPSEAKER